MPAELCYFNGRVLPLADAAVSPFDRGYNFGDGVYEVIRVYEGAPFTLEEHIDRLFRSARAAEIEPRLSPAEYAELIAALIRQSGLSEAAVYGQLTRGVAPRNHLCPDDVKPVDFWAVRAMGPPAPLGRSAISVEDDRWSRCHIKSICLLPNILAKRAADRAGADEALYFLPDSRIVTEGSASNAFAVKDGIIFTHPLGRKVLSGITRDLLLEIAADTGVEVVEEGRDLDFFRSADEILITSTTMEIQPLLALDGEPVGDGKPGPIARQLREAYFERVKIVVEAGAPAPQRQSA